MLIHAEQFGPMAHEGAAMIFGLWEQGHAVESEKLDGAPASDIFASRKTELEKVKTAFRDLVDQQLAEVADGPAS